MAVLTSPAKQTEGGTGQTTASPAVVAGGGAIPFTQASNRHREPLGAVQNYTIPGTFAITPLTVLAYGYLRSLWIRVTLAATGGSGYSLAADAPWNLFTNLTVKEPNGNPIYTTDGYGLYLANKYGGYRFQNDPKLWHGYSAAGSPPANVTFMVRVPLETSFREGLGALPNQNNAAAFQLSANLNNIASIYTGGTPPTSVAVGIQVVQEEWDQPAPDTNGRPNETAPPAVNTTQFWGQISRTLNLGYNETQLTRVGNLIRTLIFVTRNNAGARVNTVMPPLTNFVLDNAILDIIDLNSWLAAMSEAYGYTGTLDSAGALDTGVYVLTYADDFSGKPGFETRNLWLPTMPQSRLALQGTSGLAGSMDVYTNDIIPANPVRVG